MTNQSEARITEAARLIAERDRAVKAIERWEQKLAEANASLSAMLTPTETPEQVHAPE